MTRLNATQLETLNRVLLALHEDASGSQPLESMIDLIETLLPMSWISVDEASLKDRSVLHLAGRRLENIPQLEEKVARFCHQNPVIAFAQSGRFEPALKISDFTSFRALKRTAFYEEIARFLPGWRDQAAIAIRLPARSLGFALNRDRAFSTEELFMLKLLQPHIERILHRAIQYLTLKTQSPLTPREREILHWVSEGKRDSEIARILRISVRTVEQHVRVCLEKLNVETRSAATAEVWRARTHSIELGERSTTW